MNASVSFGPVFAPVSIETLADSHRLRLSNLPSDIGIEDIQALVQPCAGTIVEGTLRNSQYTASIEVDFIDSEQARKAFEYFHLQENFHGRNVISSFVNAITATKLRFPLEAYTLKVSWPKPTLLAWSHYPTIRKAKEEAIRLNGVIIKGRKIQVDFCSPEKRRTNNFAIKISNLSLDTTNDEIGQLCEGNTLITGFETPTHRGTSFESIKGVFHSFGEPAIERIPDSESDEGPHSYAFVTFPCEAIAAEVVTNLSSRVNDQSLEIKFVFLARYRVSRKIFDVSRPDIERMKEDDATNYSLHYEQIFEHFDIRLVASSKKYPEFVKANAELFALFQGGVARSRDGKMLWDDYFEMQSSAKALLHVLKPQPNSVIPDKRTRRIRLFGSKAGQKNAMEVLFKLLSKVHAQRHEVLVPRGSMRSLVEQFEMVQEKMGTTKITFDVLGLKIIVWGSAEEHAEVQKLVDSLDSPTEYKPGYCEICHRQPADPNIPRCLHVYCTPCLRMALRSASYAPLRCIAATHSPSDELASGQCLAYIPYIDGILPSTERDRLLSLSFFAHVRDSQDLFFCPSVDCKAVYRTGRQGLNLLCSRCGSEICSFCQTLAHIGLSCSDIQKGLPL